MMLRREETGVEFDVYSDRSAVAEFAGVGVDQGFERRASLRWGVDFQEAVAGMCAAAALAKLTDGVVFDEAENKLLSVDEAIALARRSLEMLQQPEEKPKFGTRPADIKRYLKPLLKQRSDLVLLDRLLIIRPVRHLLRGVYFESMGDKYSFRVVRYVTPLFPVDGGFSYRSSIHRGVWQVWQPHFKDLLFDSLAEDIFDRVAEISTLADFAHKLDVTELEGWGRFQYTRVAALALAGERDRAIELVDALARQSPDNGRWQSDLRKQRSFLERDIVSICSEFHAREREAAQEMKLGGVWEPAPFPIEVPASERVAKCAEPRFVTTPWVPRPPGLTQELPERLGEVRFATDELWRKGRIVAFLPLTGEQAEEKHGTYQDYVLFTRLDGGSRLILHHYAGWSLHDPTPRGMPDRAPTRRFELDAYGPSGRRLLATFYEEFDRPGILRLTGATAQRGATGGTLWQTRNDFEERKVRIHDYRTGQQEYARRPLSDSDLALCTFDIPPFGEFSEFWRRIETYLQQQGFEAFG